MVQPPLIAPKSPFWTSRFGLRLNKYLKKSKQTWRYDREQYIQRYGLTLVSFGALSFLVYGTPLPYLLLITEDPNEMLKNPYFEKQLLESRRQKEIRDEEMRKRVEPMMRSNQ